MIWPVLSKPLATSVAISGWASPRTIGTRRGIHGSLDFSARRHEPVYAGANGTVVARGELTSTGRYIVLRHTYTNGLVLLVRYVHMQSLGLDVGNAVRGGEQIGTAGDSGSPGFVHVHVDIRVCSPSAVAEYRRSFGWPSTSGTPRLRKIAGFEDCPVVPAEPLIQADRYGSTVRAEARRFGLTLASDRPLVAGRPPTIGERRSPALAIFVGAVVLTGLVAVGYILWKDHR